MHPRGSLARRALGSFETSLSLLANCLLSSPHWRSRHSTAQGRMCDEVYSAAAAYSLLTVSILSWANVFYIVL